MNNSQFHSLHEWASAYIYDVWDRGCWVSERWANERKQINHETLSWWRCCLSDANPFLLLQSCIGNEREHPVSRQISLFHLCIWRVGERGVERGGEKGQRGSDINWQASGCHCLNFSQSRGQYVILYMNLKLLSQYHLLPDTHWIVELDISTWFKEGGSVRGSVVR